MFDWCESHALLANHRIKDIARPLGDSSREARVFVLCLTAPYGDGGIRCCWPVGSWEARHGSPAGKERLSRAGSEWVTRWTGEHRPRASCFSCSPFLGSPG